MQKVTNNHKTLITYTTQAKEDYEFQRMQIVDEIARFLQSKQPSLGIDAKRAVKNVEKLWEAEREFWKKQMLSESDRANRMLQTPVYFWDIFASNDYDDLRRYVIQVTTNAEVEPYTDMLMELKRAFVRRFGYEK